MQSIDQQAAYIYIQAAASQTSGQPLSRNCRVQTPNSSQQPVGCCVCFNKRLVGSSLRSVANQLFLSSSSQQQRYSLMAVKNHRATQQAC